MARSCPSPRVFRPLDQRHGAILGKEARCLREASWDNHRIIGNKKRALYCTVAHCFWLYQENDGSSMQERTMSCLHLVSRFQRNSRKILRCHVLQLPTAASSKIKRCKMALNTAIPLKRFTGRGDASSNYLTESNMKKHDLTLLTNRFGS